MEYNTCKHYVFIDKLEDMRQRLLYLHEFPIDTETVKKYHSDWVKLGRIEKKIDQIKGVYLNHG